MHEGRALLDRDEHYRAIDDHLASAKRGIRDSPEIRDAWLCGFRARAQVDELSLNYEYQATWDYTQERLDVHGCYLGGDGSGGKNSKDPRVRHCVFGLVMLHALDDFDNVTYVGHASGSTPGKQTVTRSEATALLHALATTRGNAVFVVDNYSVLSIIINVLSTPHWPMDCFGRL